MFKLLNTLFLGLIVFGMAGAGSWFLMNRPDLAAIAEGGDSAEGEAATAAEGEAGQASATDAADAQAKVRLSDVPVPVRSNPATAEEIFRLGATLRKQQEALQKREEALEQKRVQLKMVKDDVRNQQLELEGLLAQIQESLKSGEVVMTKLIQQQEQLKNDRTDAREQLQQIDEAKTQEDESQAANIKKMSTIVANMQAEGASAYLQQAIERGKMDSAVQVLANLKERDAAEILGAMGDPVLVAQLMDGLQNMKRPQPPKRR